MSFLLRRFVFLFLCVLSICCFAFFSSSELFSIALVVVLVLLLFRFHVGLCCLDVVYLLCCLSYCFLASESTSVAAVAARSLRRHAVPPLFPCSFASPSPPLPPSSYPSFSITRYTEDSANLHEARGKRVGDGTKKREKERDDENENEKKKKKANNEDEKKKKRKKDAKKDQKKMKITHRKQTQQAE